MGASRKPGPSSKGRPREGGLPAAARGQSVTLVRGAHRWTFSCGPGEESALLTAIAEITDRPGCPLDRFDLSIVGQQLKRGAAPGKTDQGRASPTDPPAPSHPPEKA